MRVSIILASSTSASEITIVSWGGAHAESLQKGYYDPFTEISGMTVNVHRYSGGLSQLRKQVQSESVIWDVADMTAADATQACNEGLLEKLPIEQLESDAEGNAAIDDFLPHTLADCAVGYSLWSMVMVYDKDDFIDQSPTHIGDFFNLVDFPGKRGVRRSPRGTLEWALLADGVDKKMLYQVLSTEKGLDRAFDKLQTIKHEIVWWNNVGEMESLLSNGDVVMGAAYSTSMFDAIVKRDRPFSIVWDAQLTNINFFAIPKGTYRFASAWKFINFAASFDRMPMIGNYLAYGFTRRSAHSRIDESYLTYLPTEEGNLASAVPQDVAWWAVNQEQINQRFVKWLTGTPD